MFYSDLIIPTIENSELKLHYNFSSYHRIQSQYNGYLKRVSPKQMFTEQNRYSFLFVII